MRIPICAALAALSFSLAACGDGDGAGAGGSDRRRSDSADPSRGGAPIAAAGVASRTGDPAADAAATRAARS